MKARESCISILGRGNVNQTKEQTRSMMIELGRKEGNMPGVRFWSLEGAKTEEVWILSVVKSLWDFIRERERI